METRIATSCTRDCPCGCSLLVTVQDGEVVSQRADSRNSYTRNFLCEKGNRYLKRVYSPERLTSPLKRVGETFETVSWDEALDIVADKLTGTRRESGPLSTLWAQYSGSLSLLNLFMPRFFWIHLGGSTVTTGGISIDALQAAQELDFGACLLHAPEDLMNSRNIVIWGKNPAVSNIHLMPFIKEARRNGARLTVIDPRSSETARMADHHIAPRPGGDGYLAIAAAKEIRRRQGNIPDWVEKGANWEGYLDLLDRYNEDDLLEQAGVGREEVSLLADAYWDDRPCSTYMGLGLNWWKQGGAHCRLVHSLIYMSGNVGVAGGGANFFNRDFPFSTQPFREEMAKAKERGVNLVKPRRLVLPLLAQEIEKAEDPPIRVAWISMFNPVATVPDSNHLANVLRSLEFVVVTEQFMTATAACADIVLPVTTYLEEEDVIGSHGHSFVGPVNAAIAPRGQALSNFRIFQLLAEKLGFGDALAGSEWDWIARAWSPLSEQGITLDQVRQGPVKRPLPSVPFSDGAFSTTDGKFQFITEYEGRPQDEPGLSLLMVKVSSFLNSQLLDDEARPVPTVLLNPVVMKSLDLRDGDRVWIRSPLDRVEAEVVSSERTRADVAELSPSIWADGGRGVNRLRAAQVSDLGPTAAVNETRVTIHKVP